MPRTLEPLFKSWRAAWENNPNIKSRLSRIDQLRIIRSAGNYCAPQIPSIDRNVMRRTFSILHDLVSDSQGAGAILDTEQSQEILRSVAPIMPSIRWGRWLFLEKALDQAALCGDFLFSAVVLRSLAEECIRLRWLDRTGLVEGVSDADRIRSWAAALAIGIEPVVRDHSGQKTATSIFFQRRSNCPLDDSLIGCMQALNDYVHPNYGSHIIALYPESSEGCLVILESVEIVLEAFLSFEWARAPAQHIGTQVAPPYYSQFKKLYWRFETKVLPRVLEHARVKCSDPTFNADCLASWAKLERPEVRACLDDDEFCATLDPLSVAFSESREVLLGAKLANSMLVDDRPQSWKGPQPIVLFAQLRRQEERLRKSYPAQPSFEVDKSAWADFVTEAIGLMALSYAFKIECFRSQLLRQIVDGNPLGIAICMRSMLDHYAVSRWIQDRLRRHWDDLRKKASSSGEMSDKIAMDLLVDLNKLLAGTRATREGKRTWSSESVSVNPTTAMEHSFSGEESIWTVLRSEYDFSSASIHGRLMRSLELCYQNEHYSDNIIMRGVRLLDFFCDHDVEMDTSSRNMQLLVPLQHLARTMSDNSLLARNELARVLGNVTKLKRGRDYNGSGLSSDDPIVFDGNLQYHRAFIQYCDSENLDRSQRRLVAIGDALFDTVPNGSGAFWFKVTGFPSA